MKVGMKIGIAVMALIVLTFSTFYGQRLANNNSPLLGIEVTTNAMDNPLSVPINTVAGKKQLFVTVPVKDKTGEVSAIRIVPAIEDDKIKLDIFYLSDDYWKSKRCVDTQLLKSSRVETRFIEKDGTLNLLKATDDKNSPISIKAITFPAQITDEIEPVAGPCGCATCGRQNPLRCCPSEGNCLGCGNCGEVCCPAG